MIGAAHDLPGVAIVVDVPAPGQCLIGDADAAPGCSLAELAEIGGGPVDAAERVRSALLQIISRSQPSSCITSNLRSARAKARLRWGSGMPSKSRKGWKVTICKPRSATMRRTSPGEPSKVSRSFSKISTAVKPAAAIASSFSSRVPDRQTVAIAERIYLFLSSRRQSAETAVG